MTVRRASSVGFLQEIVKSENQRKAYWDEMAKQKKWDQVRPDLSVFRLSGSKLTKNPREDPDYIKKVVEGVGFGEKVAEHHGHLSPADVDLCREVIARKAISGLTALRGQPLEVSRMTWFLRDHQ